MDICMAIHMFQLLAISGDRSTFYISSPTAFSQRISPFELNNRNVITRS